jgi:hypothetical protein
MICPQNYYTNGSRLNYNSYKMQAKSIDIICQNLRPEPVNRLRQRKVNMCKTELMGFKVIAKPKILHTYTFIDGIHDVRQMGILTAKPLVAETTLLKLEIVTGKLKKYEYSVTDHLPSDLIKAGAEILRSEIKQIYSIWVE